MVLEPLPLGVIVAGIGLTGRGHWVVLALHDTCPPACSSARAFCENRFHYKAWFSLVELLESVEACVGSSRSSDCTIVCPIVSVPFITNLVIANWGIYDIVMNRYCGVSHVQVLPLSPRTTVI